MERHRPFYLFRHMLSVNYGTPCNHWYDLLQQKTASPSVIFNRLHLHCWSLYELECANAAFWTNLHRLLHGMGYDVSKDIRTLKTFINVAKSLPQYTVHIQYNDLLVLSACITHPQLVPLLRFNFDNLRSILARLQTLSLLQSDWNDTSSYFDCWI